MCRTVRAARQLNKPPEFNPRASSSLFVQQRTLGIGQLGKNLEELADNRTIPASGDQMTVARIISGQFLRIRDFKEHRMMWTKTLSRMLHTRMAIIHAIYLSHNGRPDGRDPASLSKFVKLLGRTKIREGCPNLKASHDLLVQVCEGHV
jgi:hypothetical protein